MSNVVLVTVDSLRADHMGAYGYDRDTSPVMDELASRGLSFQAWANSNWTRASFPAIITSTYPLEYGGFEYLSDSRTTVGSAVSRAGHETGAFHSNLWLSRDYNYDRGFDRFYDSKSDPTLLARLRTWAKLNLNHDSALYSFLQGIYDITEEKAGVDVGQTYKDAEAITDEAISWIEGQDGQFFAWIHYMDVHHPYIPHHDIADEMGLELDISEQDAIRLRRKMLEEPEELTDEEVQTLIDLYDNEIRYTDRHIGRLVDAVDESVGLDDTAFVVTSDHGEEFGEHGGFSHNPSLYDEVLSVPFIVEGSDRVVGTTLTGRRDETVQLLDVGPTVCDLAGAPIPDEYRGSSVSDLLDADLERKIIIETNVDDDYKFALRMEGWKYIWDRSTGSTELYDLQEDPDEMDNCVDDHPDRVKRYQEMLTDHLRMIRETNENLPDVSMDGETEERLKNLGYLE